MPSNKTLIDVHLPQLAESLVSATIGKWLKKPGDPVEQYEPILEVITDKVNAEIPSTLDGVMGELLAEEGEEVQVGAVICRIETANADEVTASGQDAPAAVSPEAGMIGTAEQLDESQRSRYSPAVQTLAAQHGLDLRQIVGTGLGGRITRKDVLAYIEQGGRGAVAAPAAPAATSTAAAKPVQPQAAPIATAAPQNAISGGLNAAAGPVRHSGLHLTENPPIPTIEVEGATVLSILST